MNKIVIASDSFKGSLSSMEIALHVEAGIQKVLPDCEIVKVRVADGGEGTVEALVSALNGKYIKCKVHDPLMNIIEASYGVLGDGKTAVIEMAMASGLTLVEPAKRNPMLTTTYGTGELIKDALSRGCIKFLVGIGGSATNDGGTGMLQALGFRFLDKENKELGNGGEILSKIADIDSSQVLPEIKNATFIIACDVNNPFFGENGAAYVFAPQKGADGNMVEELDKGLQNFAEVIKEKKGITIDSIPGAGAAGGLGGGFMVFLQSQLKPGITMVLDALNFQTLIQGADLIITGEGKLDKQTGMGKTPAGVLSEACKQNIPVIALGGSVEETKSLNEQGFLAVLPILPYPVTLNHAMDKSFAGKNVQRTTEQIIRIAEYFKKNR